MLGLFWMGLFHAAMAGCGVFGLRAALSMPRWLAEAKPAPARPPAALAFVPQPARLDETLLLFVAGPVRPGAGAFPCRVTLELSGMSPLGPLDESLRELCHGSTWERGGGPVTAMPQDVLRASWTGTAAGRFVIEHVKTGEGALLGAQNFLGAAGKLRRAAAILSWPDPSAETGELFLAGTGVAQGTFRAAVVDTAVTFATTMGVAPPVGPGRPRLEWFGVSAPERLAALDAWLPSRVASEEIFRASLRHPMSPGAAATAVAWAEHRMGDEARLTAMEQAYDQLQVHGHIRRAQTLASLRWQRFGWFALAALLTMLILAIFHPPNARWAWLGALVFSLSLLALWKLFGPPTLTRLIVPASGSLAVPALLFSSLAMLLGAAVCALKLAAKPGDEAGPSLVFFTMLCTTILAFSVGAVAWLQGLRPGYPLPDLSWLAFGYASAWSLAVVGLGAPVFTGVAALIWRLRYRPAAAA